VSAPALLHPAKELLRQIAEVPDLLELIISVFGDAVGKSVVAFCIDDLEAFQKFLMTAFITQVFRSQLGDW